MNNSKLVHDINKTLYSLERESHSILKSRTYTIANNARLAIRRPASFAGKAAKTAAKDPQRLVNAVLGKKMITGTPEAIDRDVERYNQWLTKTELTASKLEMQRKQSKKFSYRPLISLITPVFNAPIDAHNQLIQSVVDQTYDNFELLLYNFSNNDDQDLVKLLDDWAAKDPRIKVQHGLKNGHISKNSNRCLEDVTGEYVGLLDHDDELTSNALFECVKVINEDKKTDFIYTDKDKISETGLQSEGFFKPDWSPEMALGGNYLTHFDIMRTSLVREVGGWDPDTDGAQDWDLFLKIVNRTTHIKHIPEIVYHWRIVAGSTAGGMAAKPYALRAQCLAVQKHLERKDIEAISYHDSAGQSYVEWPVRDGAKRLGVFVDISYGDIENIESIFELLRDETAGFYLMGESTTLSKINVDKLRTLHEYSLVPYIYGEKVKALKKIVQKDKLDMIVILKDSIASVEYRENKNWMTQLIGWLFISGVAVVGPAVFSVNGQVVDVGSIYDPATRNFGRLYFGTGHQSGYNGYVQWIRNFSKATEQMYAVKTELLGSISSSIRDDEMATAFAIAAINNGKRSVYDPSITARDLSKHYLVMPNSTTMDKELISCAKLSLGDPYFNEKLDYDVHNPQPAEKGERGAIEAGVHKLDSMS